MTQEELYRETSDSCYYNRDIILKNVVVSTGQLVLCWRELALQLTLNGYQLIKINNNESIKV